MGAYWAFKGQTVDMLLKLGSFPLGLLASCQNFPMMDVNSELRAQQFGIWTFVTRRTSYLASLWMPYRILLDLWTKGMRLFLAKESPSSSGKNDSDNSCSQKWTIFHLYSFAKDIYSLGPFYFMAVIVLNIFRAVCGVAQSSLSGQTLDLITSCLQNNEAKTIAISRRLTAAVFVTILQEHVYNAEMKYSLLLCERIKYHFLGQTMNVVPTFDPLTARDPGISDKFGYVSPQLTGHMSEAALAFSGIKEVTSGLLRVLVELSFLSSISSSRSTLLFCVATCMLHPILDILTRGRPFSLSYAIFSSNQHYNRMAGLNRLAFDDAFLEDRLGYDLGHYIAHEFRKSRILLGDTCTASILEQWNVRESVSFNVFINLSWNTLSKLVLALRVLWDRHSISLSEFIIIQELCNNLHGKLRFCFAHMTLMRDNLRTVERIYTRGDIERKVAGGDVPYPAQSEKVDIRGTMVEFRNVSFKYPWTDKYAIKDISFVIKPGQIVVIVGVNGSGKSSAMRLLARLYDPTSGEILLDGLPLRSYRLSDVRRSMAILRQNHPIFPLSMRENISLGLPDRSASEEDIKEAMRQGGSEAFVQRLSQGLETVLCPEKTVRLRVIGKPDPELRGVIDDMEQQTDISGGESQRLAASRTFLRLMGQNIRLLVADEPTSALDPEGEYELFSKLRNRCDGKTAIFITHRFGHLTKHADLILCLKDGHLVEQGSHETLMALDGEYKRLYDVQAKAFMAD